MFAINDFDTQINDVILQRGKQYYAKGKVTYVEQTDDNTWIAEVEGSDTYSLKIEL